MYEKTLNLSDTIIIFSPFHLKNTTRCYLLFDVKTFDDYVKICFVTKLFDTLNTRTCIELFRKTTWDGNEQWIQLHKNWMWLEVNKNVLTLKKLSLNGEFKEFMNYHIIWFNYDFKLFSECEIPTIQTCGAYNDKSYFMHFKEMINKKMNEEKQRKKSQYSRISQVFLNFLCMTILKFSNYNLKKLPVTKYFNVALHINNYLGGFAWAVKSAKVKKKFDIKAMNFFMSVFLDMILGIFLLRWLNSKMSLDSSPTLFLLTAESVVNTIKELINWLQGDPAGLKLNWAFNWVLATFFSFHIDIWWTFMAFLKPLVKIIFSIFLKLGLLGVTFQASITADLLALVSFHVYCIYAYAAKLYSIQIASLISLWRLFLGRKKNPLRQKVDSCSYSPEQLFVGTLGFTILLFLFPTTLLYYIVFTCMRLSILTMQTILMLIRHLNQSLPVYSTILWLTRSPKISVGIEILPYDGSLKSDFTLLTVKPVMHSWCETISYFMPDCVQTPGKCNMSELLSSLISGKLIFPI